MWMYNLYTLAIFMCPLLSGAFHMALANTTQAMYRHIEDTTLSDQ